jgi:DNA-directed RNA polymerase specialized sigma24 family protein
MGISEVDQPTWLVEERSTRTVTAGDERAWDALVETWAPAVWSVAVRQLKPESAQEVCRLVWMRLADRIFDLDAESIPRWLIATTERETVRMRRLGAAD